MPQKKSPARRARRSPYLFILLAAVLLIALLFVGMRALNAWSAYDREAAVTPVPSPTVRSVIVTPDPYLVTLTPAPSPTPGMLAYGSQGEMVRTMQERLKALGYYDGEIDGQYGNGTRQAVTLFQRQHQLDDDGIAGSKTLSMLYSDAAKTMQTADTLTEILLVNAARPLPDGFVPADLVRVQDLAGDLFVEYGDDQVRGVREAVEALMDMIRAARAEGVSPWKLREGYRTFDYQQQIFDHQVEELMAERNLSRAQAISAARLTVADPGKSEHHTGLAFDLNVPGQFFADTAQYLWLRENCWEYGFIMRYTDEKEEITGILGEEWHVRYVGREHSLKIRELGYCLEEYVEYLKGQ